MQSGHSSARWRFAAVCVVPLALLLWLPYQVPVAPSVSDSYLFGFNNHVGLLVLLAFVIAAALCTRDWTPVLSHNSPDFLLSPSFLFGALSVMLLASGALSLPVILNEGIEESIYLIDRLKLVLEGHTPGVDFEFAYGPLLLYGPAWLVHLLRLSPGVAYSLFWIVLNLSGVAMLYTTLRWVDAPFRFRRTAFIFFLVVALANLLSTGINYSLFRFVSPCFFALVVYRFLLRTGTPQPGPLGILSVAPLYAALLTVSPELALAFCCGMCLFLLLFFNLRPWKTLFFFVVTVTTLALTTWTASSLQVFATLNAFRTGGYNFPIIPAPHIVLFSLALAAAGTYLFQRLRLRQPDAVVVLILVSVGSVVGALGRCDPVHVFLDPLGCWIAAFVLAGSLGTLGLISARAAFCVFVLLDAPPSLYGSAANLAKAAIPTIFAHEPERSHTRLDHWIEQRSVRIFGPEKAQSKLAELRFIAHHSNAVDLDHLYRQAPGTIFQAPFDFAPSHSGTDHTPQVDPGFYFGLENVLTPEAVRRKVAELAIHPERPLLMLATQETSCAIDPEQARQAIDSLFFYPYRAPARNPGSILEPVCTYIRAHYRVAIPASPEHFGYALWRRIPGDD